MYALPVAITFMSPRQQLNTMYDDDKTNLNLMFNSFQKPNRNHKRPYRNVCLSLKVLKFLKLHVFNRFINKFFI